MIDRQGLQAIRPYRQACITLQRQVPLHQKLRALLQNAHYGQVAHGTGFALGSSHAGPKHESGCFKDKQEALRWHPRQRITSPSSGFASGVLSFQTMAKSRPRRGKATAVRKARSAACWQAVSKHMPGDMTALIWDNFLDKTFWALWGL